ncbi:MAG TPA: DUF72 domain-containing protein [Actinomycetota bacterium]|nr:DUF72 domain-containing protein [Actinomycetota bacterium]
MIGTSGWQYRHWRGTFYPDKLASARWLEHYAARFATVEVNTTFYRLPKRETFATWAEQTPDDFVLAAKMSRYLTHIKRLRDPAEPVARFLDQAAPLGRKLGPVLLQLPPNLKADPPALSATLDELCPKVRVAVEFRHESWASDEVRQVLDDHGAATCLFDTPARHGPRWRTAGWAFVRFHQGGGQPSPCYKPSELKEWAARLAGDWGPRADIYAYFNNDQRACAPRDAIWFAEACADAGLHPTRVPAEVHIDRA